MFLIIFALIVPPALCGYYEASGEVYCDMGLLPEPVTSKLKSGSWLLAGGAMDQLIDGSSRLYDGLCTLLDSSRELAAGIDKLAAALGGGLPAGCRSIRHLVISLRRSGGTFPGRRPRIARIGCTPQSGRSPAWKGPAGRPSRMPRRMYTDPSPSGFVPG